MYFKENPDGQVKSLSVSFLTGNEYDQRRVKSAKRSETQLFTKRSGLEASLAKGSRRILERVQMTCPEMQALNSSHRPNKDCYTLMKYFRLQWWRRYAKYSVRS